MGHKFAEIAFTRSVRNVQQKMGSRASYARLERGPHVGDELGPDDAAFIAARDSFYMATVGETGWPYVQHRGGAAGFVKVLDPKTLGFPDFRGNRQYVTVGNLTRDDRVSLLFMDYPNRSRLKLLGRATLVDPERRDILDRLELPDYRARVERGILICVDAFDWNCPQHITPRFTLAEIEDASAPLRQRIAELEARLKEANSLSPRSEFGSVVRRQSASRAQQRLDRAALVHRAVAVLRQNRITINTSGRGHDDERRGRLVRPEARADAVFGNHSVAKRRACRKTGPWPCPSPATRAAATCTSPGRRSATVRST